MKPFKTSKFLVLLVLSFSLLMMVTGVMAQESSSSNSITVDGLGQAYGNPDIAYVNLGIQTSNSDVISAFNQSNETMDAIVAALQELGIESKDLQTTGLSMYQDTPYDPQTGMPSETRVYVVHNALTVTVRNIEQVAEVISTGVAAGANNINGISFGISDISELQSSAREAAIADARARAEHLASLAGVQLGNVTAIVEVDNYNHPVMAAEAQYARGSVSGTSIQEGQLSVNLSLRVTFSFE